MPDNVIYERLSDLPSYNEEQFDYSIAKHSRVGPAVNDGWKVEGELRDTAGTTMVIMSRPKGGSPEEKAAAARSAHRAEAVAKRAAKREAGAEGATTSGVSSK